MSSSQKEEIEYEQIFIKHLKRHSRQKYLDFLLENGNDEPKFYKYGIKMSRKLFIYKNKQTGEIKGVVGFSDSIGSNRLTTDPFWLVFRVQFIFCLNTKLFSQILNDMEIYAIKHDQCEIEIEHAPVYDYILLSHNYDYSSKYDSCTYCFSIYDINPSHKYKKDVSDFSTARRVDCKKCGPNRNYSVGPQHFS
jgi:hypothetical protein